MEQEIPEASKRLQGVREHLERVHFFFRIALAQLHPPTRFRFLVTCVYSCRAITELMLEAAERQEISTFKAADAKGNRAALEAHIAPKVPFYSLIERIRIHDFHRFGIRPPDPNHREVMFQGPMKLRGGGGFVLTDQGPVVSGPGRVELQRPLLINDGKFFDDDGKRFVSLEQIVAAFVEKIPAVIAELEPNWR